MSGSERAYAAWIDQQTNGACDAMPDIRVLWDRTPRARKAYLCDRCGDEIAAGSVYDSLGIVDDGVFWHERKHRWADQYPSGCPSLNLRDKAELAKQFALDEQRYFPQPKDTTA